MPFTLSHPAAAVPFARSRLALSALVIGSMAPDFEYFIHWTGQERDAHTFPGVLLLTFPAALALLVLFHTVAKWPIISLLPIRVQERLVEPGRQFRWLPLGRFALILTSLAVGIATHLAWDAFTHSEGWVVSTWPALNVPLFFVGRTAMPAYKIAQHGSTVLGAMAIAVWSARWYRSANRSSAPLPPRYSRRANLSVTAAGAALSVGTGVLLAWRESAGAEGLPYLRRFASTLAVSSLSVAVICVLAFSIVWWAFLARSRQDWHGGPGCVSAH